MAEVAEAEEGALVVANGEQKHGEHEALSFKCYLQKWAGKQGSGGERGEGLRMLKGS